MTDIVPTSDFWIEHPGTQSIFNPETDYSLVRLEDGEIVLCAKNKEEIEDILKNLAGLKQRCTIVAPTKPVEIKLLTLTPTHETQ